jgi:NAD kinase
MRIKFLAKTEIFHETSMRLLSILRPSDILTHSDPNFVVVVGGDGTILNAERGFPEVPKITFRSSDVGSKCMYSLNDFEIVMKKVLNSKYTIVEEPKLYLNNKIYDMMALNEIQIHNNSPIAAVRFSVEVDNVMLFENVIGDGAIFATPFGSSGYYKSVGGKPFENSIGIALNNPYNYERASYCFPLSSVIKIKLHRQNGILIADNDQNIIETKENQEYIVQISKNTAKFVKV